jgi:hypothetical protein
MFAIPFIMLLALLGLGSLAAVVFGIVYAIVNKRPGVAVASILMPIGVIFGVGLLAAMYWSSHVWSSHVVVQSSDPARVSWTVGSPMPPMPAMPSVPPLPSMQRIPLPGVGWTEIVILLLVCLGIAKLLSKRTSCNGERRAGWGKTIVVALLLIFAATFLIRRASFRPHHVAQSRGEAAWRLKEQVRRDVENSQPKSFEAQRKDEAAQEKAANQMIESTSIQELWEKLHQPRIKLDSDEHGASVTVGEGANPVAVLASEKGKAKLVVPISDKTPQSLARSLARLERMVEQVSAVADRVSDAGTLLGKAMIALNDTMDSRRQSEAPSVALSAPPAKVAPAVEMVAARVESEGSGEPATELATDAARPAWIDDPPKRVGNTWRQVVVAGDYATADECNRVADIYLLLVTYNHLQHLIGNSLKDESLPALTLQGENVLSAGEPIVLKGQPWDHRLQLVAEMGIGIDYIRREIATDEYLATVERSFGPMKVLYTLVEFTPSVDTELRQRWDELRRRDRFAMVGAGAGSVLGLIGVALGLLKVDTWTKGYYTKRLFLGVPAAIIGLIALLGLAAG